MAAADVDGGIVGPGLHMARTGRTGGARCVDGGAVGAARVLVCAGCGVAGGVGCGVGLTTTTLGAPMSGGVEGGSCTVGRAGCGFGCASDTFEFEPDKETGLGFAVPEPDPGTGCLRMPTVEGG